MAPKRSGNNVRRNYYLLSKENNNFRDKLGTCRDDSIAENIKGPAAPNSSALVKNILNYDSSDSSERSDYETVETELIDDHITNHQGSEGTISIGNELLLPHNSNETESDNESITNIIFPSPVTCAYL